MENIVQMHMGSKETDNELKQQLTIYEVKIKAQQLSLRNSSLHELEMAKCLFSDRQNALKYEDGEMDEPVPHIRKERRKATLSVEEETKRETFLGQPSTELPLSPGNSLCPPSPQCPPSEQLSPESTNLTTSSDYESQINSPIMSPDDATSTP